MKYNYIQQQHYYDKIKHNSSGSLSSGTRNLSFFVSFSVCVSCYSVCFLDETTILVVLVSLSFFFISSIIITSFIYFYPSSFLLSSTVRVPSTCRLNSHSCLHDETDKGRWCLELRSMRLNCPFQWFASSFFPLWIVAVWWMCGRVWVRARAGPNDCCICVHRVHQVQCALTWYRAFISINALHRWALGAGSLSHVQQTGRLGSQRSAVLRINRLEPLAWMFSEAQEAAHGRISTNQKQCQSEPLILWAPSGSGPIQTDQIPAGWGGRED